MIRAITQKLSNLEHEIKDQDEQLKNFREKLEFISSNDILAVAQDEQDGCEGEEGSTSALKFALNKISVTVKETKFSINDLSNKVNRHESEINELKLVLASAGAATGQGQAAARSISGGFNPNATEFHPRSSPRCPLPSPSLSPREPGAPHGTFSYNDDTSNPASYVSSPRSEADTSCAADQLPQETNETFLGAKEQPSYKNPWQESSTEYPESASLVAEIIYLRRRVENLEDQLKQKGETTRQLIFCKDQLSTKEKEYLKRQEWYEHKMRLLKQDKRRRGETIGKLLKCIDDMRDNGKLEPDKVIDGKLVLESTLETRGWPQEQRIKAAVQAMEAERVERIAPTTVTENTQAILDNLKDTVDCFEDLGLQMGKTPPTSSPFVRNKVPDRQAKTTTGLPSTNTTPVTTWAKPAGSVWAPVGFVPQAGRMEQTTLPVGAEREAAQYSRVVGGQAVKPGKPGSSSKEKKSKLN